MDIGFQEETFEYYRAKKKKKNEWTKENEDVYQAEPNKKIPSRRIESMLKVKADDRWWMDRGRRTETYECYRAKKIRDDKEFGKEKFNQKNSI
jgi:hypothetical protein